jgi:anti-sigma factor RsiW
MDCVEIRKRLDAWLDGELPAPEAKRISDHIKRCPACRLEARGHRQLMDLLDHLPAMAAPAGFSRRTMRAFRAGVEKPGMAEWWRGLSLAMRSAACGVALAGLLCGAVLGTRVIRFETAVVANPYQSVYASKGIYP